MNCANHPDQPASAFCRTCGKALCQMCQRPVQGTIVCDEHAPVPSASGWRPQPETPGASVWSAPNPYAMHAGVSPGLAFVLGLIPGVGAIYNGQYAKGLIHAVIFGLLISIQSSGSAGNMEPLMGILTGLLFFYMAFEAYHTAIKRQRGEVVDEFSSLFPAHRQMAGRGFPVGPVLLIALGVVFLLNTLNIFHLHEILRFWPVFLIAAGAYMLYVRLAGEPDVTVAQVPPAAQEVGRD